MIGFTYYMTDIANISDKDAEKCRIAADAALRDLPDDFKGTAKLEWNTTLAKMERLLFEWARSQPKDGSKSSP